jgi:hypothetical protein
MRGFCVDSVELLDVPPNFSTRFMRALHKNKKSKKNQLASIRIGRTKNLIYERPVHLPVSTKK